MLLLRLKFYRILARRYRAPGSEIDIIARRGGLLSAIEVKARTSEAEALEAVSRRQQRRIARALLFFQSRNPALAHLNCRFDIIWIAPRRLPKHIMDAWRL